MHTDGSVIRGLAPATASRLSAYYRTPEQRSREARADDERTEVHSDAITLTARHAYTIRVARTLAERRRAWQLAYEIYQTKGYAGGRDQRLWCGIHDALPTTMTLYAERENRVVAAVTLVNDSIWGLPADETHGQMLGDLRMSGRRPCEFVGLISTVGGHDGRILIKHLARLAWAGGRAIGQATDILITVNPRHAPFYERQFPFTRQGEPVPCRRVNDAPAVLLRIDLRRKHDDTASAPGLPASRDLFRHFIAGVHENEAWIERNHRPLSLREIRQSLVAETGALTEAQVEELVLAYPLICASRTPFIESHVPSSVVGVR